MNLDNLTIKKARELLDRKEISALQLTNLYLKKIDELNPDLNACLFINKEEAIKKAQAADLRLSRGETNYLLGIPYLAKDILMTKGIKTTAGSKILKDYIAPYNAYVIEKLDKAGAILLGKTNLDEFAHGSSTENSYFGPTKNPLDTSLVPGGSSGGSSAARAANMCLFSLGSDTGGSIRQPASFCGLVGLKPSYGLVSRYGLIAMTSSTDVIGPFTKTALDSAYVLSTIAGYDKRDANSLNIKEVDYVKNINKQSIKGLRVGWLKQYFDDNLDKRIKEKIKKLADLLEKSGAKIIPIDLKYAKYNVPVYYIITPSEISSNLARFDGLSWGLKSSEATNIKEFYKKNRGLGFGSETKRRIMLGTFCLSAGYSDRYYKLAQKARKLIKIDYDKAFSKVDVIMSPTSPHTAFKLNEQIKDPIAMYKEDVYLSGVSLAGLPAISIKAGLVDNMPVGCQLIANTKREDLILSVANFLENN